jgi:hypothetical protein
MGERRKTKRHMLTFNAPISVPSPHLLISKPGKQRANQRINPQIALEGLQIEMSRLIDLCIFLDCNYIEPIKANVYIETSVHELLWPEGCCGAFARTICPFICIVFLVYEGIGRWKRRWLWWRKWGVRPLQRV